jgi:peptidoglycan/LPS O-acetylase OafA/YrhL
LGALSFPLYAVHMPVLQGMHLLGFGSVGGAIAALGAGIAVALAAEGLGRWRRKRRTRVTA